MQTFRLFTARLGLAARRGYHASLLHDTMRDGAGRLFGRVIYFLLSSGNELHTFFGTLSDVFQGTRAIPSHVGLFFFGVIFQAITASIVSWQTLCFFRSMRAVSTASLVGFFF